MIDLSNLLAQQGGVVVSIVLSTLAYSSPLILCALGGLFSERSGVVNIGLEGMMLSAACASALAAQATGSAAIGLVAGLLAATLLALLHWLLTQEYQIDHIVIGMGINALALGGTGLVFKSLPDVNSKEMASFPAGFYYGLAWLAAAAIWWMLRDTRPGLRLTAVGNDPDKSRQMGLKPVRIRFQALLGTGLLTGLAGTLVASSAGRFSEDMTAGRGYIALAALILGAWKPWPTLAAALAFGFFGSLQLSLQGQSPMGIQIPDQVWQALPYLITLVALAGTLGKGKAPSGLGKP